MIGRAYVVAVAFACGADCRTWAAFLSDEERDELEHALRWLFKLGHTVSHSVQPVPQLRGAEDLDMALRGRVGSYVMNAVSGCTLLDPEPKPWMLVPVWSFEEEQDGFPSSSARFLSTDVEVSAVPSFDEEVGFALPGRKGLWLPFILPSTAAGSIAGADDK